MNQASRLAALEKRHGKLENKFDLAVAEEKSAMEKEINKLKEIAKQSLELQRENDQLKAQLVQEKDHYDRLAAESEVLKFR